ncbi:SH3 domain-containing protein [Nodosilinea sp. LEGE 07088]|uniref:SH3 domain-containing protein n=1 Tax=Nodosilinea sp. LEGE 07088 TaxID=2777968 RepID=UPI0018829AD8|nr:SH3 domain-containing protein [Nodosilinea sp. LEGE 07088]MBE9136845.1 SH3 domain-containing protein [Nodosilinea sp. LEGE 07088]
MSQVSHRIFLSVVSLSLFAAPAPARTTAITSMTATTLGQTLQLAQADVVETVLYFETESMVVRVYRRSSTLLMNLYNKSTDIVEVRGAPTQLVPNTSDQMVYRVEQGEAERLARINIQGDTELEIIAADGTLVLKEPGFNALVGVAPGPSDFLGNNFAPGTAALVLSAEAARLRMDPRLGSEIIGRAPRGAVVEVMARVGNPADGFIWYQATYQGVTGWIRGDLLQPT